jgi:hypothetical protein
MKSAFLTVKIAAKVRQIFKKINTTITSSQINISINGAEDYFDSALALNTPLVRRLYFSFVMNTFAKVHVSTDYYG